MADAEIGDMRNKMNKAAEMDTEARAAGQPAMYKLRMLPQVTALLNRNTLRSQLVDPDNNILEAVKFFLEPLNDGSLPAYNIQRELFAALARLPINKDALVASGIGKVVLFYTRSKKVEPRIRRQAEKLISDWMRPILKRTDDFRKKQVDTVRYDHRSATMTEEDAGRLSKAEQQRRTTLDMPILSNRARVERNVSSYTIAPKSNIDSGAAARQPGQQSEAAFRRLKLRQAASQRGRGH